VISSLGVIVKDIIAPRFVRTPLANDANLSYVGREEYHYPVSECGMRHVMPQSHSDDSDEK
jgi:hypothetical protein